MKIYFTASTAEFNKYGKEYFAIRDFLIGEKHILTRDWLPKTQKMIDTGNIAVEDIKEIYQQCIQAIREADLVVIEDTVSNFSTGHQITVALQRQKPTLVLWQKEKHRIFKKMFIHGIESDYLEVSMYEPGKFQDVIKKFIKKYQDPHHKNRFHLVLDNVERKYLDWAQFNKGESRTKVIRDAIRKQIDSDPDYQEYLGE